MVTRKGEMIVEFFPVWKENILRAIAWCLGIRGVPVGFVHYEKPSEMEPTINDLQRAQEESAMNRVSTQTTNRMESGE